MVRWFWRMWLQINRLVCANLSVLTSCCTFIVTPQFTARSRADGDAQGCQTAVWRRDAAVFLRGRQHLWEYREWALLFHLTGKLTFTDLSREQWRGHSDFWVCSFVTFQERQSIIKYWLDNLRAKQGEVLRNIHFLEGQPISMFYQDLPLLMISLYWGNISLTLLLVHKKTQNFCYFYTTMPISPQTLVSSSVPELVARGVIHQMFPLHEQRILNQLMTSWVQAVCERQPLGGRMTVNRKPYSSSIQHRCWFMNSLISSAF